jgi:hypothetical protein
MATAAICSSSMEMASSQPATPKPESASPVKLQLPASPASPENAATQIQASLRGLNGRAAAASERSNSPQKRLGDEDERLLQREGEDVDSFPLPSMVYRRAVRPGVAPPRLPKSFVGRILQLVPLAECMVPKDHHPLYKGSWIEARRHDGGKLREDMCATFELELLFSALFLGVIFPAAIGLDVTPEMLEAFRNMDVSHHLLSFACVLMGCWCSIFGVLQIVATYLSLQAIMPLADANVYAFLKSRAAQMSIVMVPNVLLVCQFYTCVPPLRNHVP